MRVQSLTYLSLSLLLLGACTNSKSEENRTNNEIEVVQDEPSKASTFEENKSEEPTDSEKDTDETPANHEQGITITRERHLALVADTDEPYRSILADMMITNELVFHNLTEGDQPVRLSLTDYKAEKEYELTLNYPLTIEEDNFEIDGGTIIGDVTVDAPGFKSNTKIEGKLIFTKQEYQDSAQIDDLTASDGIFVTNEEHPPVVQNEYDQRSTEGFGFDEDQIKDGKVILNENDKRMEEKYNFKYDTDMEQGHVH